MDEIERLLKNMITEKQSTTSRIKLDIIQLERELRSLLSAYSDKGGYNAFAIAVRALETEGTLLALRGSASNGRVPALQLKYWLAPRQISTSWDPLHMMRVSGRLDLSFYIRHPELQTAAEWALIERLYEFLGQSKTRSWVSIEERSLELFGEEKYLGAEGKAMLSRLKLTPEALKARRLGEPFVFWLRPGTMLTEISDVLIVENLSFFHTAVALLAQDKITYDVIIYGEGKKIENSFSFFYALFPTRRYKFVYAGDLDPEGYGIYARLTGRYPEAGIRPCLDVYELMARHVQQANGYGDQQEDESNRDLFLTHLGSKRLSALVLELWKKKKRIAQEVLTIETWLTKEDPL